MNDKAIAVPRLFFKQRRGFALLVAMWLIVAITTIALEFGLEAHQRREATIDLAERAQALAAATAGIESARAHLTQFLARVRQGLPFGANPYDPLLGVDSLYVDSEAIGNASFAVRLRDGSEFLNINSMTADMWRNFLSAAGLDYDSADKLSQSIMNWHKPEWITLPRGVTRKDYLHAGALVLPTNRNFTHVGELRNVLGMTAAIYAKIAPYLSVSTSGQVSFNHADGMILRSLPGFTDDVVTVILATRDAAPFQAGGTIGWRQKPGVG